MLTPVKVYPKHAEKYPKEPILSKTLFLAG
jgi:hypothetical protein